MALLVHHPVDHALAEQWATELGALQPPVRCLVALPLQEARKQGSPAPAFGPRTALLFILSSRFVETQWYEFLDRTRPSPQDPMLLSLLVEEAPIPRLLQDKAAVDVREGQSRGAALRAIAALLRHRSKQEEPGTITVPEAEERGLIGTYSLRPKRWYCTACGWACHEEHNDHVCRRCGKLRPFAGGSVTMIQCTDCHHFSIALAAFCEWCGRSF